jgi:hypothetical protein
LNTLSYSGRSGLLFSANFLNFACNAIVKVFSKNSGIPGKFYRFHSAVSECFQNTLKFQQMGMIFFNGF